MKVCLLAGCVGTGLPDGFFSEKIPVWVYTLEYLGMENVVIFFGHLDYFTTIGYILWAFGIFSPALVHCTK
jgi:hypothetical protein